jgi:uncharacterized protein (TIGR03663 family)
LINEEDSPRPGWLFWLAFAAALGLRLALLELRPLHHDEGVNAWFLNDLLSGKGYKYNPEAFHGPFLYLFAWPFARLFGLGTTALRLPVALVSASTLLLLLPLRRRLGAAGVTGAAWLLAVSPSLVFYGRDLIHETYLVFFTLALVVNAWLWLQSGRRRHLILAAACLSLMFTVKETAVLALAGLAIAAAVTWAAGLRPSGGLPRVAPGDIEWAAALALVLYVLGFTTFLTNPGGLVDSMLGLLPWAEKGVGVQGTGHEKPWPYFFGLLFRFEAVPLVLSLGGAALAWRRRDGLGVFCALWAASQIALYSAIAYKTPWLMINMVVPLALTAGVFFREAAAQPWPRLLRSGLLAALIAGLGWSAWRAVDVSMRRYDDSSLGLVYSDTSRHIWELLAFVRAAAARVPDPPGASLAVFVNGRWPIPWYLRDLPRIRWTRVATEGPPPEDVIVVDRAGEKILAPFFAHGYRRTEFLLRPAVPVAVYVRDSAGGGHAALGCRRRQPSQVAGAGADANAGGRDVDADVVPAAEAPLLRLRRAHWPL